MSTHTQNNRILGKVLTISTDIDAPLNLQLDEMNIEKELTVFVGQNGSGKSFIMILIWCLNFIATGIASLKLAKYHKEEDFIKLAQDSLEGCYSDLNINGKVSVTYESLVLTVILEKGKVVNIEYILASDVVIMPGAPGLYLSTNTRLFENYVTYMKLKKALGIDEKSMEDVFVKMKDFYKLYDIVFLEVMLNKLKDFTIPDHFNEVLVKSYDFEEGFEKVKIYQETCEVTFFKKKSLQKVNGASLSKGEQSILNMFLANV